MPASWIAVPLNLVWWWSALSGNWSAMIIVGAALVVHAFLTRRAYAAMYDIWVLFNHKPTRFFRGVRGLLTSPGAANSINFISSSLLFGFCQLKYGFHSPFTIAAFSMCGLMMIVHLIAVPFRR